MRSCPICRRWHTFGQMEMATGQFRRMGKSVLSTQAMRFAYLLYGKQRWDKECQTGNLTLDRLGQSSLPTSVGGASTSRYLSTYWPTPPGFFCCSGSMPTQRRLTLDDGQTGTGALIYAVAPNRTDTSFDTPGSCIVTP